MKKVYLRYFNDLFFTLFKWKDEVFGANCCGIGNYEKKCTLVAKSAQVCKTEWYDGGVARHLQRRTLEMSTR